MANLVTAKQQNIKLGVLYGIMAALSFAIMSVFVKAIGKNIPVSMLIFFRFSISFILLMPWVLLDKNFSLKITQPIQYIIRITTALLALCCLFYAIKFIPLVDALLLNNTAPLFVPVIAFVLTKATTPKKSIFGILLGFIGVGIILHPGKELFSSLTSLIALISGFFTAVAILQIRLISKTSTTQQMLFHYFLASTIITGIISFIQWHTPDNLTTWLLLLSIGIFGTLYQVFATLSYSSAPARLMSPLSFLIVVFGGVFDWLIWGHTPTVLTTLGAIVVILGASITVYFGHKEIIKK